MVDIVERLEKTDPSVDVTMVVNIHAGGPYLRRTMSSLETSARVARRAGLNVDLMLMLDRSPEATRAWVDAYVSDAFSDISVVALDNGSLGLSRQDGIDRARGQYIQFCDEDDLISSNTTLVSHRLAQEGGTNRIVIPQYLFGFGAIEILAIYAGSDVIPALAFFSQHPYVSRLFVHRDIATLHRFIDVRLGPGYAYEDWHFNATAVAKGAEFVAAPDVVLYYRHRSNSLLSNMNSQSARLIPPTPLFDPPTFLRLSGSSARRFLTEGQDVVDGEAERARFLGSQVLREETRLAALIDPAISLKQIADCPIVPTRNGDYATGVAYAEACARVMSRRFDEAALMASPTSPHGETALAALRARSETDPSRSTLVLLDDPDFEDDLVPLAIANAVTINVARLVAGLAEQQRDLVAYRLIEMAAPNARLHLAADHVSRRILSRYGRLVTERTKIFYRGDDQFIQFQGIPVAESGSFDCLSEHLSDASLLIHASKTTQQADQARLDVSSVPWRLAYLPVTTPPSLEASPLRRRILAVGWSAGSLEQLKRFLDPAIKHFPIIAVDAPRADDVRDIDVVLPSNESSVSYRDCLRWLAAGATIVAQRSAVTQEIMAAGPAIVEIKAGDGAAKAQAAALSRFYTDAAYRARLREAAITLLTTRHAVEAHRSEIAGLLAYSTSSGPRGDVLASV